MAELAPRPDVASRIRAMPSKRGGAALAGTEVSGAAGAGAAVSGAAENVPGGSMDEDRTSREPAGRANDRLTPAQKNQTEGNQAQRDHGGCAGDREVLRTPGSPVVAKPVVALSPRRY
ncbi:MAG: hypothetical protein ABR587_12195, partial [Candidatus Binatia bacterium]